MLRSAAHAVALLFQNKPYRGSAKHEPALLSLILFVGEYPRGLRRVDPRLVHFNSINRVSNFERYLLLAKDLPGYDVRLSLKPAGTNPGDLVGEVSVTRSPLDVTAVIQNYSAHSTGRWMASLSASRSTWITGSPGS